MNNTITYADLIQAIDAAGLRQGVIALHSSLKSFGHLEGGPETLVRAFLDAGCTLVVPTFTYSCQAAPPPGWSLNQNANVHQTDAAYDLVEGYDSASMIIEPSMGAVPACILSLPGRVRGSHPLNSFAAVGPHAVELIDAQADFSVYGPYKKMTLWANAYLVLIGVGLTRATPVHYGEERAGRHLFHQWAKRVDGTVREVEVGSCSEGFDHFNPVVSEIEKTIQVGSSRWRVFPFGAFIDAIAAAVIQTPSISHCDNPGCARCRDMALGGPLSPSL
jgi:aminoglycoside 3-N-acetyltransferase